MTTLNITNPDEFLTHFNEALNAAPSSRLRHIIRDVCRLLPVALPIVSDSLLVTEEEVPKQHDSDSNAGSDSEENVDGDTSTPDDGILEVKAKPATLKTEKRARAGTSVRPRYAACVNCGVEYDVTKNSRGICCFHPEEAVQDEKYWDRIDLWEDEEIDTEENREDHPEGFVYGCCGKCYGEEGCKVGWHEEEGRDRKRKRI
ncbi:uncharacterized protein P174DRAFT_411702 [Aspergillus novofumigatus IBT 16806]|uniref:Uncharacterized protein n=1 Tax=Aspergillus novofumigatus (strain IBT 16806) TaxID=1392255 RepID=A0A2I1BZD0_ASPN1|nr:uncharacterized protein P174DRAFT_411702 [Aspergillus novofumigatus IBT 16806]PKX90711.1 hypothetical protein P174DRAFT_411702 [Aspergillus novofumigatus IBT 16806]